MFVFAFAVSLDEQKAKGDVKKKGRLDPYAYVPLNRTKLNRRYDGIRAPLGGFLLATFYCMCM